MKNTIRWTAGRKSPPARRPAAAAADAAGAGVYQRRGAARSRQRRLRYSAHPLVIRTADLHAAFLSDRIGIGRCLRLLAEVVALYTCDVLL